MVKVTLEKIECDVCGAEGVRYTIGYPDGMKVLDRCSKHDKAIVKLKEEAGAWTPTSEHARGKLTVLSPEEILARRKDSDK